MSKQPKAWQRLLIQSPLELAYAYFNLTLGALCVAASLAFFLIPNNIVAGGVVGIAQLLRTLFNTPVGLVSLLINIPLFVLGWRYLGGLSFGVRTIYATVVLSLATDLMVPLANRITVDEPLLYVFYGGLLDGIGVGLIFRAQGTSGGIDIVARFLQERYGIRPGQGLLLISAIIFGLAGWFYGATPVLYALLVAFIGGRVVDIVLEGFSYARSAIIISNRPDEIRAAVLHDLGRGVTVLSGQGGYTDTRRPVLLCVVAQSELGILKALIEQVDPGAFVIISEAAEVLGEGFKSARRR